MKYAEIKLAHLGANSEDGVSAVDEVEGAIREVAKKCVDLRYGNKGQVTLTIDVANRETGDDAVIVAAKVAIKNPRKRHNAVAAYVNQRDGSVKVNETDQLSIDDVIGKKKEEAGKNGNLPTSPKE